MRESAGRQTLTLAMGAALVGLAWGYLRHRAHPRRTVLALAQGAAWFVACGGAAALVELFRDGVASDGDEFTERVVHSTQTVTDRAPH